MVTVVWATRGIDIFFLDTATQAVHRWIALDWVSKKMQFQKDSALDRKMTAFAREKLNKKLLLCKERR